MFIIKTDTIRRTTHQPNSQTINLQITSKQFTCTLKINMQLTSLVTILAVAVAGVAANPTPWHHPPPPPPPAPVTQIVRVPFDNSFLFLWASS
jgi:hypothetical protein